MYSASTVDAQILTLSLRSNLNREASQFAVEKKAAAQKASSFGLLALQEKLSFRHWSLMDATPTDIKLLVADVVAYQWNVAAGMIAKVWRTYVLQMKAMKVGSQIHQRHTCPYNCLYTYMSIHMSIHVPTYMLMHMSIHMSTHTCTHVYTCLGTHVCAHAVQSVCMSTRIAVRMPCMACMLQVENVQPKTQLVQRDPLTSTSMAVQAPLMPGSGRQRSTSGQTANGFQGGTPDRDTASDLFEMEIAWS